MEDHEEGEERDEFSWEEYDEMALEAELEACFFRLRLDGNPSLNALCDDADEDFVPGTRQWLFDDLEAWRQRSEAGYNYRVSVGFATCPFYILSAPSGFGKTLALSRYIIDHADHVLAWHFCRQHDERSRSARAAVRSIAFQLGQHLGPFYAALQQVFRVSDYERRENLVAGDALSTQELFDVLVLRPLQACGDMEEAQEDGGKHLIVLDGLEVALDKEGNALGGAVLRHFRRLPNWIGIILSTRPEVPVGEALQDQKLSIHELHADGATFADAQDADVEAYVEYTFGRRFDTSDPCFEQLSALLRSSDEPGGARFRNFLFLHLLLVALLEQIGEVGLAEARTNGWLPEAFRKTASLSSLELYDSLFKSMFHRYFARHNVSSVKRLFYAIIAAPVPLHLELELAPLCEMQPEICHSHVNTLEDIFLHGSEDGFVCVRHESVREWVFWEHGYLARRLYINHEMCHYFLAKACAKVLIQYTYVHLRNGTWLPSDAAALDAVHQAFHMKEDDREISSILGEHRDTTRVQAYALMFAVHHLLHAHPPTHAAVRVSVQYDKGDAPSRQPSNASAGPSPDGESDFDEGGAADVQPGNMRLPESLRAAAAASADGGRGGRRASRVSYEVEVYLHMALRICCSISFNIETVRILGYSLGREQRYRDLCRLCDFPETQSFEFAGLRLLKASYKGMRRHWRYQEFMDDEYAFMEQVWQRFVIPFEEATKTLHMDRGDEVEGRFSFLDEAYDRSKHVFVYDQPRSFSSVCRTFCQDLNVKRRIETGLSMVGRVPGLLADSKVIDRETFACKGAVGCIAVLCLPLVYGSARARAAAGRAGARAGSRASFADLRHEDGLQPLHNVSGRRRVSTYLIMTAVGNRIFVFEYDAYDTGEPLQILLGHGRQVTALSATMGESGNGYLCSSSEDRSVRVWVTDATDDGTISPYFNVIFSCITVLSGHSLDVTDVHVHVTTEEVALEPDAPRLKEHLRIYSGSEDQRIIVWHEGGAIRSLRGHTGAVTSVRGLRLEGGDQGPREFLVSGSEDRTVRLWDGDAGTVLRSFRRLEKFVTRVTAFAPRPDTIFIAVASMAARIHVYRYEVDGDGGSGPTARGIPELEPVLELEGHTREVTDLALVQSLDDDASGPEEPEAPRAPRASVGPADSFILLSTSRDNTARIWLLSVPREEPVAASPPGLLGRSSSSFSQLLNLVPGLSPRPSETGSSEDADAAPARKPSYATEIIDLHGNWAQAVACSSEGPREGTLVVTGAKDGHLIAHMLDMTYALTSRAMLSSLSVDTSQNPEEEEEEREADVLDTRISLSDMTYVAPSARESLLERSMLVHQESFDSMLTTDLAPAANWSEALETAMHERQEPSTLGDLFMSQLNGYRSLQLSSLAGAGSLLFAGCTDRTVRAWNVHLTVRPTSMPQPEPEPEMGSIQRMRSASTAQLVAQVGPRSRSWSHRPLSPVVSGQNPMSRQRTSTMPRTGSDTGPPLLAGPGDLPPPSAAGMATEFQRSQPSAAQSEAVRRLAFGSNRSSSLSRLQASAQGLRDTMRPPVLRLENGSAPTTATCASAAPAGPSTALVRPVATRASRPVSESLVRSGPSASPSSPRPASVPVSPVLAPPSSASLPSSAPLPPAIEAPPALLAAALSAPVREGRYLSLPMSQQLLQIEDASRPPADFVDSDRESFVDVGPTPPSTPAEGTTPRTSFSVTEGGAADARPARMAQAAAERLSQRNLNLEATIPEEGGGHPEACQPGSDGPAAAAPRPEEASSSPQVPLPGRSSAPAKLARPPPLAIAAPPRLLELEDGPAELSRSAGTAGSGSDSPCPTPPSTPAARAAPKPFEARGESLGVKAAATSAASMAIVERQSAGAVVVETTPVPSRHFAPGALAKSTALTVTSNTTRNPMRRRSRRSERRVPGMTRTPVSSPASALVATRSRRAGPETRATAPTTASPLRAPPATAPTPHSTPVPSTALVPGAKWGSAREERLPDIKVGRDPSDLRFTAAARSMGLNTAGPEVPAPRQTRTDATALSVPQARSGVGQRRPLGPSRRSVPAFEAPAPKFAERPQDQSSPSSGTTSNADPAEARWAPELAHTFEGHRSVVTCVTCWTTPKGGVFMASGSEDQTVRVYDVHAENKEAIHVLKGHRGAITCLCAWYTPLATLVSGSEDCTLRVWDVVNGGPATRVLREHTGSITSLYPWATPNGTLVLISSAKDGTVRMLDLREDGTPLRVFDDDGGEAYCTAAWFTSTAKEFVAGGFADGCVRVWDTSSGAERPFLYLEGHDDCVTALTACTAASQQFLASGSADMTVRLWNTTIDPEFPEDADCICLYAFDGEITCLTWLGSAVHEARAQAPKNILAVAVANLSGPAFLEVWDADDATGNLESYDEIFRRVTSEPVPSPRPSDEEAEGMSDSSDGQVATWMGTRQGLAVALGISTALAMVARRVVPP